MTVMKIPNLVSSRVRAGGALSAVCLLLGSGTVSKAAVLVDFLGSATTSSAFNPPNGGGKALVFTTGLESYSLDGINVRMQQVGTGDPLLTAAIYSSTTNAGNIGIGELRVAFTIPALADTAVYQLAPVSSFVLEAETTYWFVMHGAALTGGPTVRWYNHTGTPATTGGFTFPDVSTTEGQQVGLFPATGNTVTDPSTWTGVSSTYNDVQIIGTLVVPEPSFSMLFALACSSFALIRRRCQPGLSEA